MKIVTSSGDCIIRDKIRSRLGSEESTPTNTVLSVIPRFMANRVQLTPGGRTVIQHRTEEPLRGGLYTSGIMNTLHEASRKPPSGALSAHCNTCFVNI